MKQFGDTSQSDKEARIRGVESDVRRQVSSGRYSVGREGWYLCSGMGLSSAFTRFTQDAGEQIDGDEESGLVLQGACGGSNRI